MCFDSNTVRPMLAKLIANRISHFTEDVVLNSFDENIDTNIFQCYLSNFPMEIVLDIREQASKFPLEPTTIRHHLAQVYKGLITFSPSSVARSMIFVQFILELCYNCVLQNKSNEIRTIHEYGSRLLIQPVIPSSNWCKYVGYFSNLLNVYHKFV